MRLNEAIVWAKWTTPPSENGTVKRVTQTHCVTARARPGGALICRGRDGPSQFFPSVSSVFPLLLLYSSPLVRTAVLTHHKVHRIMHTKSMISTSKDNVFAQFSHNQQGNHTDQNVQAPQGEKKMFPWALALNIKTKWPCIKKANKNVYSSGCNVRSLLLSLFVQSRFVCKG